MNVFEYAKKMELDGINFYLGEWEHTTQPGFRRILQTMIDEERKHYIYFDTLQQKTESGKLYPFPDDEVENIFQNMIKNKEGFDFSAEQVETYRRALEIEKISEKFYRDEAKKTENEKLRAQLIIVAEEEEKHVMLMDYLVEYINRPNDWVEHAMFSEPRDEY